MSPIEPHLSITGVHLAVADLARSTRFYERTLGLTLIESARHGALLGAGAGSPALHLHPLEDPTPAPVRATGLFHVAWLHPDRASLAETVRRVAGTGWRLEGAADHGVSEALYLSDPDGLGVELYADRPRERWPRPAGGRGVLMSTAALDLEDLLAQSTSEPSASLPAGAAIGHIHLKVADVERSAAFYRDALGLEEQARMPSAAFLSAGGYHHHVGLNSWQSAGARAAAASAPGLRRVEFSLAGADALDALAARLEDHAVAVGEREGALLLDGPDGETLAFAAR